MSDEDTKDTNELTNDLVTAATGSIVRVFEYLAQRYGDQYPDDVALNKIFTEVLAGLLGDMLAHYPDDVKDDIITKAYDTIAYSQAMTEVELASAKMSEEEDEPEEAQIIQGYDLANMKPLGNA